MGFNTNTVNNANTDVQNDAQPIKPLDWNSPIDDYDNEFVVFPEGDYVFRITNLEKTFQKATPKIPSGCNKALITIQLTDENGRTTSFKEGLLLVSTMEWKLSSFFRSIGLKKHGEKLVMDWSKVVGACGKAHVSVREWIDQNGNTKKSNQIDKYLDPEQGNPW